MTLRVGSENDGAKCVAANAGLTGEAEIAALGAEGSHGLQGEVNDVDVVTTVEMYGGYLDVSSPTGSSFLLHGLRFAPRPQCEGPRDPEAGCLRYRPRQAFWLSLYGTLYSTIENALELAK